MKGGLLKRWSMTRGRLIWGTHTFVTSKASLTKGVVFSESSLSKGIPLYSEY